MCDQVSLTCVAQPVVCGAKTCAKGQACVVIADLGKDNGSGGYVDPYTTGTTACSCVPGGYSATHPLDSCEADGKICDDSAFNPSSPAAMTCRNPGDREDCINGISTCTGTGITCQTLTFSDGSLDMCAQTCAASSACPVLSDSCQAVGGQQICWNNICAQPWTEDYTNQVGTENTSARTAYFQACNAAGTGDGICLPYSFEGYGTTKGQLAYLDIGVCLQNGTSANSKCDVTATRSNLALACPAGTYCDQVLASTSSPNGVCRTTCNAAPSPSPTRACSSAYCYDTSVGTATDYYCTTYSEFCNSLQAARIGVCETNCNILTGSPACAATDALGDTLTCSPYDFAAGAGYCQGIIGTGVAEGAVCTYPAGNASSCAKGKFCYYDSTTAADTCLAWCNSYTGSSCPSGSHGSESCYGDGTSSDHVGLCCNTTICQ
jgi:hypothetical protein